MAKLHWVIMYVVYGGKMYIDSGLNNHQCKLKDLYFKNRHKPCIYWYLKNYEAEN